MTTSAHQVSFPPTIGTRLKRIFLGKPLISERLESETLSNPVALGAIAPDAISSIAYGPEQILVELVPVAGLAAFVLLFPIVGVILLILALVTVSYRQVLMAYTRVGGSYVVARENLGRRMAQIAAAALLIDYVVTVAVQPAAGAIAVVSAIPQLRPYHLHIAVAAVLITCLANLRGLRRAGRAFAVLTYGFIIMLALTIVTGVIREIFWGLPRYALHQGTGLVPVHRGGGLVMGATILVLLGAFAHGGTSMAGIEAVSNTVDVFRKPRGPNARRVLTVIACVIGFLLAGVAYLAHHIQVIPYRSEYPSMLSEITRTVFGNGAIGQVFYFLMQASTAAILFTGANTAFTGFPALASFVAADRFLPRPLIKRGYRLVFSNGVITLTALAVALLLVTRASVHALIPLYAMGVFTAFAMAGYGMTKHHASHREPGWRYKLAVNLCAGVASTVVVGIFAITKFKEGAWLIVVVFPVLVFMFIRLNNQYRAEATVLDRFRSDRPGKPAHAHHTVFLCVNTVDVATLEALRYGRSLRADELTAVHFMIDAQHASQLRESWQRFDLDIALRVLDCPDRQLTRATQELVVGEQRAHPDTDVTVLLPRRAYGALGRLLHDRTADEMAEAVSRTPNAAATIVPYDVRKPSSPR
ncbi:APC family permease [Candidatus Mycobacterium methanotrophicum]|uniref:APC family permease n=1 Tax=Candidatus Mycobacterium methanotrophicum TaxID=2943498 RepID=UPI001C572728